MAPPLACRRNIRMGSSTEAAVCELQSRLEAGVAQSRIHVPFLAAASIGIANAPTYAQRRL